jgi:gliding motility-associated-like protein
MFSCTSTIGSFQIVLYETTNIIENYLTSKPNCPSWAGGTAVQGLHNSTGTVAFTVAGRNSTQWTATNEGWRYTPNGPSGTSAITWYRLPGPVSVGTGASVTVTPPTCQINTTYYAELISSGTCVTSRDSVIVTQTTCSPCALTAGNNGPICVGSTLSLTASAVTGATYSWTGPNGFTSTLQNPTITSATGLAAGVYTVTATQAASCNSCTATTTVVVNPIPPAPTPTNSGPVCSTTDLYLFTPTVAGATYSWTGPAGFTSSLQNPVIPAVTGANGGVYSVTVTVAGCTSPAGTTTVIVKNTPAPPVLGSNSPQCAGSFITLTASNIAGATYAWSGPAGYSSTVRNPPAFLATPAASGTYTCTVTVNGCVSNPATINYVVNPIPVAPTVSDVSICYNTAATLVASVSGPTYEWFDAASGGTLLATGDTYTTPLLTSSATYYVHSTSLGCTGPMSTVNVTVTASFSVDAGLDDSICSGGSSTLTVVAPTAGGYTYTWNPGSLPGSSVNVSPASTTTYTLSVVDGIGCTGSDQVTVFVGTPVTATASGVDVTCFAACNGSASVVAGGGFTPYTYAWSNGATTASPSALCANTYTVTVTDVIGCQAQDVVTITEPTDITLTVSAATSHCSLPDGSATVVAAGGTGAYTYLWSPGGQTTATATALVPGSYCVTVTDANGCTETICATVPNTPGVSASISSQTPATCNGDCDGTATVSASAGIAPYTYAWSNGQTTNVATGLCAGSYTCTVTDASGCTSTVTVVILQPTPVLLDAIPAQTICIGQSATLTGVAMGGNAGGYVYTWNSPSFTGNPYVVSPGTTTTYSVTAVDPLGCASINTQTVTVTVRPPLSAVASPDVSICPGGNTTLSATASGGDASYIYSWMPGGGTASTFTVSPATTTTYTITVTDGCTTLAATDMVTVTVLPNPTVVFNSSVISGCTPLCVNFSDLTTITGGTAVSWNWVFGSDGTSSLQNPLNCFENAGVYDVTLTVTTNLGCVSTLTIPNMITAHALPTASFVYDPQPASIAAPNINFHDLSTSATSWFWDFGDTASASNTSNLSNPMHTYSDTGTYCVTLIVTNTSSCADTAYNCELVITPEFTFYIPSAFTPNNDGLNDVFMVKGEHIQEFTMRIYDRWGQLTYFSKDINQGWDGRLMKLGEIAQQDTYVYMIELKDKIGERHQYIGHVTIIK